MATNKPRITVTLKQEDYLVLTELSKVNGQSMSAIVAELVSTVTPVMARVIAASRVFERSQDEAKERVRAMFDEAEERVLPAVKQLEDEFMSMLDNLHAMEPEADQDPRPVTRGSRPPASPHSPTSEDGAS